MKAGGTIQIWVRLTRKERQQLDVLAKLYGRTRAGHLAYIARKDIEAHKIRLQGVPA